MIRSNFKSERYKPSGKFEPLGLLLLPAMIALGALIPNMIALKTIRPAQNFNYSDFSALYSLFLMMLCVLLPALVGCHPVYWCKMRNPILSCCLAAFAQGLTFLVTPPPYWLRTMFTVEVSGGPPGSAYGQSIVEQASPQDMLLFTMVCILATIFHLYYISTLPFSERTNRWLPRLALSKNAKIPSRSDAIELFHAGIECKKLLAFEPLHVSRGKYFTHISLWMDGTAEGECYIDLRVRSWVPLFFVPEQRVKPQRIRYADAMAILERFGPAKKVRW